MLTFTLDDLTLLRCVLQTSGDPTRGGACVKEESLAKSKVQKVNDVDSDDKSATLSNKITETGNKEETEEEAQPVKPDECTAFLSNLSAKVLSKFTEKTLLKQHRDFLIQAYY